MKINPFFRCKCGKLHVATFISDATMCKCGEKFKIQILIVSTNAGGDIR